MHQSRHDGPCAVDLDGSVSRSRVRRGATVPVRFFAPAAHSPRFYREYFKPQREREIEKDRRRWLVSYRGAQFYVHVDRLVHPPIEGCFLEVKSWTWSRRDAQDKATIITELLERLGAGANEIIDNDYVDL
ncbi:MAG: hypothetical protein ACJ746_29450 [Bryobacteraceae bacterium]